MIVYGRVDFVDMGYIDHGLRSSFPSKITALQVSEAYLTGAEIIQFEWAWQKPELSRHLRLRDPNSGEELGPMFQKDAKRNWMERKVAQVFCDRYCGLA